MPPMTTMPRRRGMQPQEQLPAQPQAPQQQQPVPSFDWNPIAAQYEQAAQNYQPAAQQQPAMGGPSPFMQQGQQQPQQQQPAADQFMQPQQPKGFRQWLLEDYGVNEMPDNARVDIQQAQKDYARYRQSGTYGGAMSQYQMMNLLLSKQRNDMTMEDRDSQASNRKADNLFRAVQHLDKQISDLQELVKTPMGEADKAEFPEDYAAYQENQRRIRDLQRKRTSLNNRWLELTDPELASELYDPGEETSSTSDRPITAEDRDSAMSLQAQDRGAAYDMIDYYTGSPSQGGGAPAPTASPGQPAPTAQPSAPQPQAAKRKFVVEVLEGAKRGQRLVVSEEQLGQIPESSYRVVDEYKGR